MKLRRYGSRAILLCAVALLACVVFGAGSTTALAATQTIALSVDNLSPDAGQTVTLTATVTSSDNTMPTGNVKFFDGGVQMGDPGGVTLVPVPGSPNQAVALFSTSFVAGTHTLTASYRNKQFITTTSPGVVLNVGHVGTHPTTVTLSADPAVVVPGEPVTLTATVAETAGGTRVPTGLVSFDDNGVPFFPVSSVLLDANGQATLTVSGFGPGAHVITASYPGDGVDSASQNTLNVTVPEEPSAVDTTIDVSVDPQYIHEGDSVTIVAHVQQVGKPTSPPEGSIVSFYANDVPLNPGSATLDANGNATIVVTGGWQTGDYTITATYVGDELNNPSQGTGFVSVLPEGAPLTVPTQLAYTGDTTGVYGESAQLSAVLTNSAGPVAGETVTLTLGTQSCTATTDANGLAACTITLAQTPGNYTVDASFAGDGLLLSSDDSGHFAIGRQTTTLTYTGATSADYGDPATLSATLRDASGTGLSGKSVTLALGTQSCTVTTTAGGVASCSLAHVAQTPGSYTATASFAGDTIYFSSADSTSFQINREATTASVATIGPVAAGAVQLHGTLFEDGLPLGGATVTLSLGSLSCTTVTSSTGAATCSVTTTTLGPASVGITYAGDANYVGSSASLANGALVYAFAPGAGSFVIGDGNAALGTSVTFWGAQWAKLNRVSGGSAPSAFKGYAAQGSRACGGTWTTGPGNSPDPPKGPLPAYMAVLVTSSAGKSGAAISGSTVHVVVVRTDGGYKNDPGHAGTGTVVATVC